jgi:ATP-dependent helicase HrpA
VAGDAPAVVAELKIRYPAELPITERHDELLATIAAHQVVIVAGETGSGKSTQLPKLCLELGRGVDRLIGHTQPRRVAARTIAARVAEELGVKLGAEVGYSVRFDDRVDASTRVRVMTDGVLLAELQRDRMLKRYDTIIIDEAHERSLNIDFLLGYLHSLLRRRADLKLIITSATIDTERFATHFAGPDGTPAPVVEIGGRGHPVEVRYRPPDDIDQAQAICDATEELFAAVPGDVLVFVSGESEIRDATDALGARFADSGAVGGPCHARGRARALARRLPAHAAPARQARPDPARRQARRLPATPRAKGGLDRGAPGASACGL